MTYTKIRTFNLLSGSVASGTLGVGAITGFPASITADDNDLVLIYDDNLGALRKMTRANFTSGIAGDITGVTAGTGLSGGGNTGAVTLSIDDSVTATVSGTNFTGNVGVTGSIRATLGMSGSLTRLVDGTSYLAAGAGISITSSSNGQVLITNDGTVGDITSVTAGTGLSGGGSSGGVTLSIDDSVVATISGSNFAGNVGVTGSLGATLGFSGSLTRLLNGKSYLAAGSNVTITSASNGQVLIAATDNNTEYTAGTGLILDSTEFSINDSIVATISGSNFAGNVGVTGSIRSTLGYSGSLTRLLDGTSYLAAGTNVTITSASNGQVVISSTAPGTPGGSDTQVQFNDGGSFGGDAGLIFNKTSNSLYAAGVISGALGFSGSLTRLIDGTSYLAAGSNVTITSASNGQVSIAAATGLTEISQDTSPELGGQLVTGDHKISFGTGDDTSEIDLKYNGSSSHVAIASIRSIDLFLDSNLNSGGTENLRIFNDLEPASSHAGGTNTNTNAIFRVHETGNVLAKGYVTASMGFSGSLTRLVDGTSYLAAGSNVTITSASNGQVLIAATDNNTEYTAGTGLILDGTAFTINDSLVATISGSNFAGNVGVTGSVRSTLGYSGSLTRLLDGTSYLAAGSNVTITSASNGQVLIAAATGITELSDDTSPELGGQLVTGDHKIAFGTGNNTSEIDFTYNAGGNFTAIASVKSIDMFLDLNGGDSGQKFRIFNNLQPTSAHAAGTNTDTNAIFMVREEGNVFTKGHVTASLGFSGSLTRLTDGTSYLAAGSNVTITSASNGQVTISSTGGGGGTPGGSDTQVQFNDGGSFGGDAGLLYNKTSNNLYAQGVVTGALGFSGSLTRLVDGTSYLAAGANVTITSASNGQVLVASTDTNTEYTAGTGLSLSGLNQFSINDSVVATISGSNFAGNVGVTGSIRSTLGYSGSLTRLLDGTSYMAAGANVTITSASNGQVVIAASDNNTEYTAGTGLILDSTEFSINDSVVATISGSNFAGNVGITGSLHVGSSAGAVPTTRALNVYANVSGDYAAHIDNDRSSSGHGLKVTSDGTGSGTILLDVESASTTHFRVRGDGRVGIGKVTSLPAVVLTVSSSNDDGDIAIAHKIQHIGDDDTFIAFDNDDINLQAGGVDFIKITEDGSQDIIIFNDGSADVDFRVESNSNENMFFVEGQNNRIGVGTGSPLTTVHISGSASDETALTIQGQADVGIRLAADRANVDEGNNPYIDFYQDGQNPTSRNNRLATIAMEGDAGTSFDDSLANVLFIDTFCPNAANSNLRPFQIATDSSKNSHSARITIEGVRGNVGLHTAAPAEALHLSGALRIDSQGRENLLVVSGTTGDDAHQLLVMSTTTDGYGDDTNFYVSGTIGSRGTSVKGTSVYGGDLHISGNLTVDGTGVGGSPGGSNTELQFNDGGSFGGISGATTDGSAVTFGDSGILVGQDITHAGDADTKIVFADDAIGITVGGEQLLTVSEAGTDMVTVGDGGDVDFRVRTNNDDNTLYIVGSTDNVGIGLNNAATTLHLKDSDVAIRLQRENNSEASTIEFAGSGGNLGASIAHDNVGNDMVFDVFDGSGLEESIRLGGYGSGANRQVIILSGNTMHAGAMQPRQAADIAFFVSGAIGSTNTAVKGAAVFGGDTVISGALFTHDTLVRKSTRTVLQSTGSIMNLSSSMNFFSVDSTAEQSGIVANTYDMGVTNGEYDGEEVTIMYTGSLVPSTGTYALWSTTSDYVKQVRVGYAGAAAGITLAFSTGTPSAINGTTLGLQDINGAVYSFTGSSTTSPGSPAYSSADKSITYGVNGISSTDEAATALFNGISLARANGFAASGATLGGGTGRIQITQDGVGIAGNKAIAGTAISGFIIGDIGGTNAFTGGENNPNAANVNYTDVIAGGGVYLNYKSPSLKMVWDSSSGKWNVLTYNGVTI